MFSTVFEQPQQGQILHNSSGPENAPFPDLKLDTFPAPLEAKIELWLEPGAEFITFQEEAVFFKPENLPSVEQGLAATKSDATLANVPKTLCFPIFLSRVNFVQFKWT